MVFKKFKLHKEIIKFCAIILFFIFTNYKCLFSLNFTDFYYQSNSAFIKYSKNHLQKITKFVKNFNSHKLPNLLGKNLRGQLNDLF